MTSKFPRCSGPTRAMPGDCLWPSDNNVAMPNIHENRKPNVLLHPLATSRIPHRSLYRLYSAEKTNGDQFLIHATNQSRSWVHP
ncbi:hypothetical protein XENTR_v10015766 [Xenopus tropicalis]|nr:hypothetical protein XENTR_v10015766 [Xenopus tropicalis]